jgi:hypothetical protein
MTSQKTNKKQTQTPKHMIFIFIITFFFYNGIFFFPICYQNKFLKIK